MIIPRKKYRKFDAINFSKLSALDRNPESLVLEESFESKAFDLGNAFETLLLEPNQFKKDFIYYDKESPTNQLLTLVESCHAQKLYNEFDIEAYVNNNIDKYFGNVKNLDKRKEKWNLPIFYNYLDFLKKSEGKTILSYEEYLNIQHGVELFKSSNFTKNIINDNTVVQLPIVNKINGFLYKGLLDFVNIEEKDIYPFDLKTTSDSIYNFTKSFFKYRYYLQGDLYKTLLSLEYPNHKIHDFIFIVYSFKDKKLLKFNMKNYHIKAKEGFINEYGKPVKGWSQLTEELMWHKENNIYDFKKEIYDLNGEIVI